MSFEQGKSLKKRANDQEFPIFFCFPICLVLSLFVFRLQEIHVKPVFLQSETLKNILAQTDQSVTEDG